MSITAVLDFVTGEWEFTNDRPDGVAIGFRSAESPVIFNHLAFDWQLIWDGRVRSEGKHPAPGVEYVMTDQPTVTSDPFDELIVGETYTLKIHARNADEDYRGELTFTVQEDTDDDDSDEPV